MAERAIDVWEDVKEVTKFWMGLPKAKQPREDNKSYQRLKAAKTDPLIPVKLKFFADVADELNKFLIPFQTDKPMVPFLAQSLKLTAATTCLKLSKIDFKDQSFHKRPSDVSLPIPVRIELANLKKQGKISDTKILQFKSSVICFLSTICAHLVEKSPLKYPLSRNAKCLIPSLLVEAPETSKRQFERVLETMYTSQQMSAKMVKEAKLEFDKFLQDVVALHRDEFLSFDNAFKDQRLDAFYFNYLDGKPSFSNLSEVLKMILTLSHGQASVERGFSVNQNILVENMKAESLMAQRIVNDHMKANDLESYELNISPELRRSVKSSRQAYSNYLQNQKKEEKETKKSKKRKLVEEEIAEVKRKRNMLSATIDDLQKDVDKFAAEAEKSSSFEKMKSLLAKSNSFRVTAKEKLLAIEKYDNRLKELNKENNNLHS